MPALKRPLPTLSHGLQDLATDQSYCRRYRQPLDGFSPSSVWPPTLSPHTLYSADTRSLAPRPPVIQPKRHATTSSPFPPSTQPKTRPLAVLFPGSGSQFTGMGAFLIKHFKAARETWQEAEEILGGFEAWRKSLNLPSAPELQALKLGDWPPWINERSPDQLRKIVFGGAPQSLLTKTSNAQPAILITSMAILRVVEKECNIPISDYAQVFCGHSSGEFAACTAAGAMSFEDALRLSRLSGLLTSRTLMTSNMESYSSGAPPERRSQMTALLLTPGHSHEEVTEIVQRIWNTYGGEGEGRVEIAAYNSSSQIVLSGSEAGVDKAADELYAQDIAVKATNLPVWVPFHSSFMRPAEAGVRLAIDRGIKLRAPRRQVISCLTGESVSSPDEIADALVSQMSRPVQWTQALDAIRTRHGISEFIFMGPGRALANLALKEASKGVWDTDGRNEWKIGSATSAEDLQHLKSWLG